MTASGIASTALLLAATAATRSPVSQPSHPARALATMLVWLMVILVVFLFSLWGIARFSRGFRDYLLREPADPTAADDVWTMHKLPRHWDNSAPPPEGPAA
ncbi:MAG: hypothetical protein U1A27_09240 [Phycisphaerae bacterium]